MIPSSNLLIFSAAEQPLKHFLSVALRVETCSTSHMEYFEVETPVTGTVWKINFQAGEDISQGDVIMIMEAMKMEIPVESPASGKLKELLVSEGDQVSEDDVVAIIEAA